MKRIGLIALLIGLLSVAGTAAAERERPVREGSRREMRKDMSPEMKAIHEKYKARREQVQNETRQKMKAIGEEEHKEIMAAMNAAHERRMKEIEAQHTQRLKEGEQRREERTRAPAAS